MQISPRCYALTGFAYTPPWGVNAGIVAGNETTLIVDSGPTRLAAETILGYARVIRPANRLLVINTEQHLDHIGGNCLFVEEGIDVYGHKDINRSDADLQADIKEYHSCISDKARRDRHEEEFLFARTVIINPTKKITTDMRFDLGGLTVEIIMTPGHTPTNLGVVVPSDRVAYCGDAVVSGYSPNLGGGTSDDWRIWLESLKRIAGLNVEVLVCGHGGVLRGASVAAEIGRVRGILEMATKESKEPG